MTRPDNLERDLTMWLADTATPRLPDFTDDILWLTARTRQRPRWTFAQRWLPVSLVTLGRRRLRPVPWRTLGLLAALGLLIVAAAAFYVGSQPRLPPPIGLAATGLVAYASGGDIYTVDPITGAREAIVTGSEVDREPRWSLDGTRLAFLRASGPGEALVIFDRQRREVVTTTDRLFDVDDDSVAWSPDGRSVAVAATARGSSGLFIVDASSGALTRLTVDYQGLEAYWRPPDGRQLMFLGGKGSAVGLFMVDVDDGGVTEIVRQIAPGAGIRPSGWTPDGSRVVFTRDDGIGRIFTHILDVTTRAEVIFEDVGHAHVSNDGSRIVALNAAGMPCVAQLGGGPCVAVGRVDQSYVGTHAAGAHWSPDDEWILFRGLFEGGASLVDPDGQDLPQPSWIAGGAESIQRVAP
jgi:dipeptidyl aminopeptidase/acylaminoacyl peptidase